MTTNWFSHWDASTEEFNEIFSRNPSIRGMVHGYLAEEKLKENYWEPADDVSNLRSPDDHDREKKADWIFDYEGNEVFCEVKSLQSNHVERVDKPGDERKWQGKFQCDASDKREVRLPNGTEMETTCLVQGEFDVLAVNLFEFGHEWRWAFARNEDLPRTPYSGYDEDVRKYLLKGTMDVSWPLPDDGVFHDDPWEVLREEIRLR